MTYTPPQEPVFRLDAMTTPRPRRKAGLVGAAVAGVLALMAITGLAVWYATRSDSAPAAASASPGPPVPSSSREAVGTVVLRHSQFRWGGLADHTCRGWQGFDDIGAGTQVTVTDAAGKALAIGSLDAGTATGITSSDVNGLPQAELCTLPFKVPGLPAGVGPYGIEVAHRGVVRFDEGKLGIIQLGF